jgi:tagatose 1,6-diphosphate aldolase
VTRFGKLVALVGTILTMGSVAQAQVPEQYGFFDIKHAFVERIGSECEDNQIPFFLEFVGYDPKGGDERGVEFARTKPEIVKRSMEEFSKPQYQVDVLKVEVPVNAEFVVGTRAYRGQKAYTREEALRHFREAASSAGKPFIYLSAGVNNDVFVESLTMAAEAGTDYSGVLCGRATWKDGIPVYAKQGLKELEDWLEHEGVKNIQSVNAALHWPPTRTIQSCNCR